MTDAESPRPCPVTCWNVTSATAAGRRRPLGDRPGVHGGPGRHRLPANRSPAARRLETPRHRRWSVRGGQGRDRGGKRGHSLRQRNNAGTTRPVTLHDRPRPVKATAAFRHRVQAGDYAAAALLVSQPAVLVSRCPGRVRRREAGEGRRMSRYADDCPASPWLLRPIPASRPGQAGRGVPGGRLRVLYVPGRVDDTMGRGGVAGGAAHCSGGPSPDPGQGGSMSREKRADEEGRAIAARRNDSERK